MKKSICIILVIVFLLSCLTGCGLLKSLTEGLENKSEASPLVDDMMSALAENRTADAKALLHPDAAEDSDAAIAQLCDYLDGREAVSISPLSINIQTSASTSGKSRQEEISYRVDLNDDSVIYINAAYLSDKSGSGFLHFQFVIGLV